MMACFSQRGMLNPCPHPLEEDDLIERLDMILELIRQCRLPCPAEAMLSEEARGKIVQFDVVNYTEVVGKDPPFSVTTSAP